MTTKTNTTAATMAAEGAGLTSRPSCAYCNKLLRPSVEHRERAPTPAELAHELAARAKYDVEYAALQRAFDDGDFGTDEYNRAARRITRSYEQRRYLTPGVRVYANRGSVGPVARVSVRVGWGDYGDGLFCTLRCGRDWAVATLSAHRRRKAEEAKRQRNG